jgi:hypothetical protein
MTWMSNPLPRQLRQQLALCPSRPLQVAGKDYSTPFAKYATKNREYGQQTKYFNQGEP